MPRYELSKCTSYKNCASVQFVPDSLLNLMICLVFLCCLNQVIFGNYTKIIDRYGAELRRWRGIYFSRSTGK